MTESRIDTIERLLNRNHKVDMAPDGTVTVARFDVGELEDRCRILEERNSTLTKENDRLTTLINTPHTAEFLEAVKLEAIHQRERWGSDQDAGKTDADWFWLVGYLAGKAIHKADRKVHHIITTAAALLNWHAAVTGSDNRMRPGIKPPASVPSEEQQHD